MKNIKNAQSEILSKRAERVLPGPQSNLRIPLSISPTYIERGEGVRLWDVDGREYIDFMIAVVPAFWDISTGPISHKDIVQNIDLVDVLEG